MVSLTNSDSSNPDHRELAMETPFGIGTLRSNSRIVRHSEVIRGPDLPAVRRKPHKRN
jgi:hypothetical protein